jgi:hypothetical protein
MRVSFSLCSAALLLSGCYSSLPTQLSGTAPGTKLVVSLTDAGSDSLARYLGPGVATVSGKLLSNTDAGVSLSVTDVTMRSGAEQFWKGETVALPKYAIGTVMKRSLSKPKTLLVVGAIIVAGATVRLSGVGQSNSGRSPSGPGGPR